MPFVPVPNTALVEIRLQQDSQKVENTLYFELGTGWDATSLGDLGTSVITWWETFMSPLTSNTVVLREVVCTDLTSDIAPSIVSTPGTLVTGDDINEALPNNVSLAISFRTAGRGRSSRGRNYFVGITDEHVAGNTAESGFVSDLTAAYLALGLGGSFDVDAIWCVVSRFHNNAPRTTGIATPITSVSVVDDTIDSQRRRLPGRGR